MDLTFNEFSYEPLQTASCMQQQASCLCSQAYLLSAWKCLVKHCGRLLGEYHSITPLTAPPQPKLLGTFKLRATLVTKSLLHASKICHQYAQECAPCVCAASCIVALSPQYPTCHLQDCTVTLPRFAFSRGPIPDSFVSLHQLAQFSIIGSGLAAGKRLNARKEYLPSWLAFNL